jgi:hypothetical protein
MSASVIWAQACKAAADKKRTVEPKRAKPASWAQIKGILTREGPSAPAMAILIGWLACARMGDVRRLRTKEVVIHDSYLQVTFRKTKTRNTYTVATTLPPEPFLAQFTDFIQTAQARHQLFNITPSAITAAMRREVQGLTQHSLRRGALQTLSKAGLSTTALLHFSGHKSVASLMTYLEDGARAPENPTRAVQARILVGGGITDAPDIHIPSPPSYHQLLTAIRPQASIPYRPPLHIKQVEHMNIDALLNLPIRKHTSQERFVGYETHNYTSTPSMHQAVLHPGFTRIRHSIHRKWNK